MVWVREENHERQSTLYSLVLQKRKGRGNLTLKDFINQSASIIVALHYVQYPLMKTDHPAFFHKYVFYLKTANVLSWSIFDGIESFLEKG